MRWQESVRLQYPISSHVCRWYSLDDILHSSSITDISPACCWAARWTVEIPNKTVTGVMLWTPLWTVFWRVYALCRLCLKIAHCTMFCSRAWVEEDLSRLLPLLRVRTESERGISPPTTNERSCGIVCLVDLSDINRTFEFLHNLRNMLLQKEHHHGMGWEHGHPWGHSWQCANQQLSSYTRCS